MFNIADKDSYGTLAIQFDIGNKKIAFYNDVDATNKSFGDVEISIPFNFETNKMVHFEMYYGSRMAVLYANGEVALSTRLIASVNKAFSIFSKDKKCSYRHIRFYE